MSTDRPPANTYEASLRTVLAHAAPLPAETVPLPAAAGRVLAEAVHAGADDPPAPKSAMDGFALRSADTQAATPGQPITLAWSEVVGAGHTATAAVAPGTAIRLMTGALLPEGADAVVKQEDTTPAGERAFTLTTPLAPGENVIPRGAALRAGTALLQAGERIGPQGLGLLAGQGLAAVRVLRRPRVGLLALGDELVEPGRLLAPGQLHVSNLYALEAQAAAYGAEPLRLGIVGDDREAIAGRLAACLPGGGTPCDVLITLGGSHHGDFDHAAAVLAQLGATLHFRRTLINFGGSTLFATRPAPDGQPTLCFGLPGTPAASWMAFELLVRPALLALQGRPVERAYLQARLTAPVNARPGRTHFVPVRLTFPADGPPEATPLTRGTPFALPPSLMANGLLRLDDGAPGFRAGDLAPVAWLEAGPA